MSMKNIPTEAEFARASAALEKRSRGLDQVRDNILCNHWLEFKFHEFFILDASESSFRAYVFFEREKSKNRALKSGLKETIENCIYNELENAGRGASETISVTFEYDSHENIEKNFEGNYYNRLK